MPVLNIKNLNNTEPVFIEKASSDKDIESIYILATEIWREHFTKIIGKEQVEYMLDKFQSQKAIRNQIETGYDYFILLYKNELIGYLSIFNDVNNKETNISKIYIKKAYRRLGIATEALEFVKQLSISLGFKRLWMVVNRRNDSAINAYKKMGFMITGKEVKDIGNGFVMDDYRMVKEID